MTEEITATIERLKQKRNAVILVHNYESGEVQDIADYVGDSLGLSRTASETDADVIVFCGVHFMAETASILCPDKTVLLPDANAGCPMANMITPRQLQQFKDQYPGAVVVTYVNSSAAIKAMSDICCTSANAVEVVRNVPEDKRVLFVPDRNLGSYVAKCLDREVIVWNGFCPTHERALPDHVEAMRKKHPNVKLVVHPECRPSVVDMADKVASTTGILRYCREQSDREFIIATEHGILHRLQKENPEKTFYEASMVMDCPNMKLCTLEKVMWALEDMEPEVKVDPETAKRALSPILKMLETVVD